MTTRMEMTGRLRQTLDGWLCECEDTVTGEGDTPEAAYFDWMAALHTPAAPDDDAYDAMTRHELRAAMGFDHDL